MTTRQLLEIASQHTHLLLGGFGAPPVLAVLLRLWHGRGWGGEAPFKYIYSVLIYLVCIPGMLAATLTGYALLFTGQNLLDVNLLIYALPMACMALTLLVISRAVRFEQIPGFRRLSGLMGMMALTFLILFALSRTRIWLLFGGSIFTLIALAAVIFLALKGAAAAAFGRGAPRKKGSP